MKKFLKDIIVKIDGEENYKQNGRLRKIINKRETNFKLIESAHDRGYEGVYKTYQRLKSN